MTARRRCSISAIDLSSAASIRPDGLAGDGFASKFFSDWTFAPLVEVASGRPFNIITGNGNNFQLSSLTGPSQHLCRPGLWAPLLPKYSPTGRFPGALHQRFCCNADFPTLLQLDGNLGRNAGVTPWTVFNDLRVAKRIYFGERFNMELIADMFNIANRYNVSAVSPLFTNAGTGDRGLRSAAVPVRNEDELVRHIRMSRPQGPASVLENRALRFFKIYRAYRTN